MEYTCAGGAADHSRSRRGAGPTEESVLSTHPLSRLFAFARPYRRNAVLATVYSVLNKFFDVLPELLIGVAVDVVVNQKQSFLAGLGIEPLDDGFDGPWLHRAGRGRKTPAKLFLMDGHQVVGIGNIYASESLFRAGIDPTTPIGELGPKRCARLVACIRETLQDALAAGGSTLRDFVGSNGAPGYFQQQYFVYGRDNEPCRKCSTPIRKRIMGQRASFYCPRCQH